MYSFTYIYILYIYIYTYYTHTYESNMTSLILGALDKTSPSGSRVPTLASKAVEMTGKKEMTELGETVKDFGNLWNIRNL